MREAFEKSLEQKIIIPDYNTVMGAFGVALLLKENPPQKTEFLGFGVSDRDIKCTSDCNYIFVGTTDDSIRNLAKVWIVKIGANGSILWDKAYTYTNGD